MKKQIIAGITITACIVLCAAVWPRSSKVEDLPAESIKAAVSADIEAHSEEMPKIFLSADTPAPEVTPVEDSEPSKAEITTEKEIKQPPAPTQTTQSVKPTPASAEPRNGSVRIVDGEKQIYLLGFGWIKDEGGSVGTVAEDMYENGNKIGVMGSGTIGNPGDKLTGNKVGIIGGTVGSNGDINKQVGIMGGDESAPQETAAPPAEQSENTGDVIYVPLQPPVTKDSTPPAYKPNGEPYNP